jgi:hypothetical protein
MGLILKNINNSSGRLRLKSTIGNGRLRAYSQFVPTDADAAAFLTAAGITDATITDAINDLVISLKSNGLWSKMIAIYPLVGGTASTHKWNLKDPRDLDVAFRLTFVGSPTHDANGMQGNGTSQYANTHLTPSISLAQNNASAFYYVNQTGNNGLDLGSLNISIIGINANIYNASNNFASRLNQSNLGSISGLNQTGFYGISRTGSSNYSHNLKGTISTINEASTGRSSLSIFLMAFNTEGLGVTSYSSRRYAFFSFGEGLNSTEQGNLKTAVDTFQTALNRS